MKKWIIIAVAGSVWILVIYPLASVYREIRRERVVTAFSSEVRGGNNLIQLRLPQGSYLCVLSRSEQLLRGVGSINPVNTKAVMTAMRNNEVLDRELGKGFLRFYVGDDTYQPVFISCDVPSNELEKPLFLTIGGTF